MEKFKFLDRIKALYEEGGNIIQYLKSQNENPGNTLEDILISYDFQAGNYMRKALRVPDFRKPFCQNLQTVLSEFGPIDSILEIGVGEATTLGGLLLELKTIPSHVFGFDISWSRIKYARQFIRHLDLEKKANIQFCTGDLFNAPFADSSIDVVYTAHSLEPNGGKEKEALEEIYRITRKYMVLLEPAFELASPEAKQRMLDHGYVTKLRETAESLNYNVVTHRLFHPSSNPLNPTGLLVIKKEATTSGSPEFACPITKDKLENRKGAYYSEKALMAYPVIDGIPCLLPQNAVVATHFLEEDILP